MPSILRQLQREWNALVPQAQAVGLRGVREVALYPEGLHERIPHRRRRLEWLRSELNAHTAIYGASTATPQVYTTASATQLATTPFTFGVELEVIMPAGMNHGTLAAHVRASAGIECNAEMYNHSLRRGWKVVTDGSLGDYQRGAEVVSPVLEGEQGISDMRKVCVALERAGCTVRKTCGMHVHLGARNEDVSFFRNLVKLYAAAEATIDTFLSPSRRGAMGGNGFCRSIRVNHIALGDANTLQAVANAIGQVISTNRVEQRGSGRYCKLNLQSFGQHGTVEFRHHQGTVDADKAEHWVRFCLRMGLAARNGAVLTDNTLAGLLATVGATEKETQYFTGRASFFAQRDQLNRRVA